MCLGNERSLFYEQQQQHRFVDYFAKRWVFDYFNPFLLPSVSLNCTRLCHMIRANCRKFLPDAILEQPDLWYAPWESSICHLNIVASSGGVATTALPLRTTLAAGNFRAHPHLWVWVIIMIVMSVGVVLSAHYRTCLTYLYSTPRDGWCASFYPL